MVGITYNTAENKWKTVYSLDKKTVYLIWDNEGNDGVPTYYFLNSKWKVITAHELGHAMGYEGHSETGLMHGAVGDSIDNGTADMTTAEYRHLMQMYN